MSIKDLLAPKSVIATAFGATLLAGTAMTTAAAIDGFNDASMGKSPATVVDALEGKSLPVQISTEAVYPAYIVGAAISRALKQ